MNKTNYTLEIMAIGKTTIYSIGKIQLSKKGDIYLIQKDRHSLGMHLSRHRDGTIHTKMKNRFLSCNFTKRVPIKDFKGFEFLQTWGFGLESLPVMNKEYKYEKCDAVIAIDMRPYKGSTFNLGVILLTQDGLPKLFDMWKNFTNRQIYISAGSFPMIAVVFGSAPESITENIT
jgi:hypothetical protein